jgi:hypothetical protein
VKAPQPFVDEVVDGSAATTLRPQRGLPRHNQHIVNKVEQA